MAIKVKAINPGHYGQYREVGDQFEIKEEKHFSKKWMAKVGANAASKPAQKGKGKPAADEAEDAPESEESSDQEVI